MTTMDVDEEPSASVRQQTSMTLHRVRFVDWSPSAVTSIAFLPLASSSSSSRSLMAVGRENGNIDLSVWVQDEDLPSSSRKQQTSTSVLPKGWLVDTTLVGAIPSKIDTLAFVLSSNDSSQPHPRLFSTSGGAIVTEHFLPPHLLALFHKGGNSLYSSLAAQSILKQANLRTGTSRTISSQGGSVWCMSPSPLGRYLAIGCEDGYVRIVDIQEGRFELLAVSRSARRTGDGSVRGVVTTLDRAKTRIISLAWGPPRKKVKNTQRPARAVQSNFSDSEDSSDDDEDDWEESFLIGGTTHSSALVWSLSTGQVESKLLVDKSRAEQTIIWSVAVLRNGTIILGDSLGHVSFFDARSRTLLSGGRFTSHGKGADVLTICVGSNGETVYSAGLDQKVVEYTLTGTGQQEKWITTGTRRLHAHDIRALAIDPPFSLHHSSKPEQENDRVPILVSGGSDFNLVFTPASPPSRLAPLSVSGKKKSVKGSSMRHAIARFDHINPISTSPLTTFTDTIQRRVSFVPSTGRGSSLGGGGVIRMCPSKRWLLLRREKSVGIWQLSPPRESGQQDIEEGLANGVTPSPPTWIKVLEMQMKLRSNIVCAEISNDGRFMAVGDLYETKLYELLTFGSEVTPKKVKSFTNVFQAQGLQICPGSSATIFTPENSRVVLASHPGSFIHVVELPTEGHAECRLLKTFDQHRNKSGGRVMAGRKQSNGHSHHDSNGHAHSEEGESNGLENGEIDDEEAEGEEENAERSVFSRIDLLQISPDGQYLVSIDTSKRINTYSLDTLHYYRPLPSTSHVPSSIAFDMSNSNRLCFVLPTNQVVIYSLEERNNDEEQRLQDRALEAAIMERIVTIRESAIGAVWMSCTQFLIWGSSWICSAKLSQPLQRPVNGTKRGRVEGTGTGTEAAPTPTSVVEPKRWNVSLSFKYQPLLYVGLLPSPGQQEEDEMVVIERPYYDIARSLPPTWFNGASYGT
ncbi:hypothetical protein CBS101457_004357 [Exobasidium rhododendri]|nr:hypothetical protein CBS101457_004357 [Exobasidium rhododendri]